MSLLIIALRNNMLILLSLFLPLHSADVDSAVDIQASRQLASDVLSRGLGSLTFGVLTLVVGNRLLTVTALTSALAIPFG